MLCAELRSVSLESSAPGFGVLHDWIPGEVLAGYWGKSERIFSQLVF